MQIKKLWKRVGTLAAATMLMAPLGGSLAGGQSAAKAETTDSVNIKLHKMETSDASTDKITNTGDELSDLGGNSVYDPEKYGHVEFTLYDVSGWFDDDMTNAEFVTERNKRIEAMSSSSESLQDALKHQNDYLTADKDADPVKTYSSANAADFSNGQFNIDNINNSGYYLIVESAVADNNVNKFSVPLLFRLPLAGKSAGSDVHLYAKNQIQTADPTTVKEGQDINEPDKWINLGKVDFTLADENGIEVDTGTTNGNGEISFKSLKPGDTYTLTETANNNDGYDEAKVVVEFKVDADGKVTIISSNPEGAATADGSKIKIKNYLKLGDKTFQKTDENNRDLAGAEFIVQHPTDDSKYAQFSVSGQNYTFEKWVSEGLATTIKDSTDGKFTVSGLPIKNGYRLIETKAPDGYSKLGEAKLFDITSTSGTASEQEIENKKYDLPITGGMGLLLFILAGLALMGTSAYLYRRNKKQANK